MTNAEFAVLSLLAEQPRHGYAIEETIELRGMREWTEVGFSSIYYLLKKLQTAGLVSTAKGARSSGGKARKVYCITANGLAACSNTAKELLANPHPTFPSVLLGLANVPLLLPGEALESLRTRDALLAQRLAVVEMKQKRQAPLPAFVNAIFAYSIALLKAEQMWLNQTIKEMERDGKGRLS
jgi:DNA-binding PadR family transcriptional regulator